MARRKPRLTEAQRAELERQKEARRQEVERLRSQGLDVKCDAAWNIIVTRRVDVFSLFHERKAITDPHFYAARRLEALIALAYGHEKPDASFDRVDSSTAGAPGQNITQAMIDAGRELEAIYIATGNQSARLLHALMTDQGGIMTRWRDTVYRITSETNPTAQAAAIRIACANLAMAFQAQDYGGRKKRERAA